MNDLPIIPSIYLIKLIELMKEENLVITDILHECGFDGDFGTFVSINQFNLAVYAYLEVTKNINPGVSYGLILDSSVHGLLGHIYSSKEPVIHLIKNIIVYMNVRLPIVNVTLYLEANYFGLQISSAIDKKEINGFLCSAFLTSFYKLGAMLMPNIHIHIKDKTLKNNSEICEIFQHEIHWKRDIDELRYYIPLKSGQSDLMNPKFNDNDVENLPSLVLKLRQYLMSSHEELTSTEKAASKLGMSERTLRRKLAEVGYSYRQIRQEMIMQTASRYLQDSNLSIGRVAEKCGYCDQASFTRAFQKWHSTTPDSARKQKLRY